MSKGGLKVLGDNHSKAIVFLHSSLSSSGQWGALLNQLKDNYKCICVDLYGYGNAPDVVDAQSFSMQEEVQRIRSFIENEHVTTFSVIGHSYGGAVGLALAHELHLQVEQLILFEPVAFNLLDESSLEYGEVLALVANMANATPKEAARYFVDYWNFSGYFDSLPVKIQLIFEAQVGKIKCDFQALTGTQYTLADYARTLTMPCHLLQGKLSRNSAKQVVSTLTQHLKNTWFTEVNAGHMAPISHADMVNPYILESL
ncbi:alpha/beta fold hydrolase [Flocculibacter collagenilyticus]|uniref:alpha/beta fold hydrolase n=1 Tax=Flocculibacter collagenilyticus TaxID=2744479 RepID=UPI0018F3E086|nr:alpha/beta hydrolase [Flocculibacter collagenilyticus]